MTFYTTAFEEAFTNKENADTTEQGTSFSMPSYMVAADTHNVANKNESWDEALFSPVESVAKFVTASLVSGANQLYNAPIDIGNAFGADWERSDTGELMSSIDSDLGTYYAEHKEGVDTLGFIASAMIPGMAGVKALHAGQAALSSAITAGRVGNNMSKALGLLIPSKQKYLSAAIKDVVNGTSAGALSSRNTLKAIASGFGQSTLEAGAFEIAVAGTLFKSPIVEQQDVGDLITNIAFGGVLGGVVGGAVDAAKVGFSVKKAVSAADKEAKPWTAIAEPHSASDTYEKVIFDLDQLNAMPDPKLIGTQYIPFSSFKHNAPEIIAKKAVEKAERLNVRVRKNVSLLAKEDQDVAGAFFETTKDTSYDNKLGLFMGLKETAKLGEVTAIEKELNRLTKKGLRGTADIADAERLSNLNVGYMKVWGHEAGKVMGQNPTSIFISDLTKKGERLVVSKSGVKAGRREFKFNTNKQWDALKATPLQTQARHIWAQKVPGIGGKGTKTLFINEFDIPLMERAYKDFNELTNFKVRTADKVDITFTSQSEMFDFLKEAKIKLANRLNKASFLGEVGTSEENVAARFKLLTNEEDILAPSAALTKAQVKAFTKKASTLSQEDIASMVNVKASYLSGQESKDAVKDLFALQSYGEEYAIRIGSKEPVDIWNVPQNIKLTYDSTPFESLNGHVVENMVILKEQQKAYVEGVDRAIASILEDDYNKLLDITAKDLQEANSNGAGGGFVTAASSNYGTLASKVEYLGNEVTGLIEKGRASAREILEPVLYRMSQSQGASIEFSTLNAKLRAIPEKYALNEAGDAFEPLLFKQWKQKVAEAREAGTEIPKRPILNTPDAPELIPIKNQETRDFVKAHIELNGDVVNKHRVLRTARGAQDTRQAEAFYPIPVDPKDYPYFALVTDESISGTGHTKTLYASSEQELNGMIDKLRNNPQLRIRTKNEAKAYWESIGQYDYEKSLNDNYLDITMHRKGVSAPYIVPTDPKKIVTDALNWHMQRQSGLVREIVSSKYEVQFNELRRMGDNFTNIATSQFSRASTVKYAENVVKNPYADYIKVALGISKQSDYPWWINPNRMADESISNMYRKISNVWDKSKSPEDLGEINKILKESGYTGAAYNADMEMFANSSVPKGVLSSFIQKANSMLATVVLRWDALNAVNNAVSANVLLGAETKAVIRAINAGNAEAVGELAALAKVKIPGSSHEILSPAKLIANSIKRFGTDSADMAFYKEHRFVTNISDQYRWTLDNLTLKGTETVRDLEGKMAAVHSKLTKAATFGEKWTGNKLAEEFNRFVAADVMKQLTDVAVKHGVMDSKTALSYINTFVNRTQGNYLAAQRPMMFQGPIGQAIGLFQTYQFNLMQQLLRHVGEGGSKDAMTLLALQGTIHGMNGLPAFNAVNTYLIGNASGNREHKDLFDTVYGAAGKEAGDWLMYGAASNMFGLLHPDLKMNLYTRGDINPRHLTIVPTDPSQVPIVQASAKFFANMVDTAGKINAGGDVATSILQGIEHNGISRPLAGLAQTLEGLVNPKGQSYSTSRKGNIIASNDMFAVANLGRIAGGKPFDEAIAIDASYRFKAYALRDMKKRQELGRAIKTTVIAGLQPTQEQIDNFIKQYVEYGGKQANFNKWFGNLYTAANVSQANTISQNLNGQYSKSMQRIMGGLELKDFEE